jgi:hypothetical protein
MDMKKLTAVEWLAKELCYLPETEYTVYIDRVIEQAKKIEEIDRIELTRSQKSNKEIYYRIIHTLAGIAIGFELFYFISL